jgi:hypothetical protein
MNRAILRFKLLLLFILAATVHTPVDTKEHSLSMQIFSESEFYCNLNQLPTAVAVWKVTFVNSVTSSLCQRNTFCSIRLPGERHAAAYLQSELMHRYNCTNN